MDTAGGKGHHGGGGGVISEWSSTIGIVTAIVGNLLISVALNIQRYAHIRINREHARERLALRRKRDWAARNISGPSAGDYGTLAGSEETERPSLGGEPRRDAIAGPGQNRNGYRETQSDPELLRLSSDSMYLDTPEHMQRSFMSERTVRSLEKRYQIPDRKSYLHSPYWWAGLILMVTGEAGNFLAYGFAPASIVSPLGVVALISNCVIAPFMLKERFRRRDLWGVLVAVAGAVTVVLSAKTSETKIGPHEIWGRITQWEFELYLGITVALILVLMWISEEYGRKTILIDLGLVGLFGGYTALSTKGVSSLLSYTLWHVITFPITYLLIAVLVGSAMMQIKYLNRALARFDSTQVIPTQFVMFTISVIIGSAVLYRDFESATAERAVKFVGGCSLTFLGVWLITSGRGQDGDDDSDLEDEEETIGLLDSPVYSQLDGAADHQEPAQGDRLGPVKRRPSSQLLTDEEDGVHTPRAHLLSSPESSSIRSISDTSSLIKSRPESTKSFPQIAEDESAAETGLQAAESAPDVHPPPPAVLLRFPSAPDAAELPLEAPVTPGGSPVRPSSPKNGKGHARKSFSARTPGSFSRTPLSLNFSPGPLFTPLSSGLSAVVAESIRRSERTPDRRKSRRRKGKTPRPEFDGGPERRQTAGDETDYETDDSLNRAAEQGPSGEIFGGELHRHSLSGRPSGLPRGSPDGSREEIPTESSGTQGQTGDVKRGRSVSDTWSEGLSRFGSVRFWKPKRPKQDLIEGPSSPPDERSSDP